MNITLHRITLRYVERITAHEYLVNCIVLYKRDKYRVSKENILQFRIPEIKPEIIRAAIITVLERDEDIIDFIREFNEVN